VLLDGQLCIGMLWCVNTIYGQQVELQMSYAVITAASALVGLPRLEVSEYQSAMVSRFYLSIERRSYI
jgi:hypothetical protein